MKLAVACTALIASAHGFSVTFTSSRVSTVLFNHEKGAGGMFDTRNPDELEHEDARKSISAAPSFEEYLKMREGGNAVAAAEPASEPSASAPASTPAPAAAVAGSGDAIATLQASQAATIDKIASAIPDLAPKPDFTWTAASDIAVDGSTATLDALDAPGPANIAWIAAVCVDSKLSSLTIFNGPLTDVPHLVSRCAVVGDQLQLKLDFRPRSYGAYELSEEERSPDALGRKAFEYSGARNEFDTKFGNDEMKEFLSSTMASFDGASPHDPIPSELDLLTRGPLFTSVTMPNTDANAAAVAAARERAADFWLSWAQDSGNEHRPGAPVNTQYVYDSKFKLNAYGALLEEYSERYGKEDGQQLAIGESGPLDEAYVGGGS